MKQERATAVIESSGGKTLLDNLNAPSILNILAEKKSESEKVKKFPIDNTEGWVFFLDKDEPPLINVTAYYCQKGEWPVYYWGKLIHDTARWYFIYYTDTKNNPYLKLKEFLEEANKLIEGGIERWLKE